MIAHETILRDYVVDLLKGAGSATFGDRVFGSRGRALWKQELPAVLVYLRREQAEVESEGDGRVYSVVAELVTEVVVRDLDTAEAITEQAAAEIREAIFLDETLGDCASDCRWEGTDSGLREEADQPVAVRLVRWEVSYRLAAPEHRAAPDLELVGVTTEIGPDGTPTGEDLLEIDQSEPVEV